MAFDLLLFAVIDYNSDHHSLMHLHYRSGANPVAGPAEPIYTKNDTDDSDCQCSLWFPRPDKGGRRYIQRIEGT